ncbi:MAG: SCO family protein [Saprospiraceae bacterium]|nr:SCO family protein [Saprospiraceae bacterium]
MTSSKLSISLSILISLATSACSTKEETANTPLPIIGERLGITEKGDTIYPTIPHFAFVNQNGDTIKNANFDNKIYVVDFFFTHCPTICPKVTAQMLRVYDHFKDSSSVGLLSHTIDPKRDSVGRLRDYADKLGVSAPKWHFVTSERDSIYSIADNYFSIAKEDPKSPGGFDHSGRLILVDKKGRVRSFCDGTDTEDVDRFMKDVERLCKQ